MALLTIYCNIGDQVLGALKNVLGMLDDKGEEADAEDEDEDDGMEEEEDEEARENANVNEDDEL